MLRVEVHFKIFSDIFNFFGYWPLRPLTKLEKVLMIGSFVFCIILPGLLIGLSFPKANNVEEFANTMIYFFSYCYVCSEIIITWYHREKIKSLTSKMIEYFYNNDEAVPFITCAVVNVKWMSTLMMTATMFIFCFLTVIIPAFWTVLPIPMWKPKFLDDDITFGIYWLIQIYSIMYSIGSIATFSFMCSFLVLINGYAEYLRYKLRMLASTRDYSGYLELVDCIQVHRKLKE